MKSLLTAIRKPSSGSDYGVHYFLSPDGASKTKLEDHKATSHLIYMHIYKNIHTFIYIYIYIYIYIVLNMVLYTIV